MIQYDIDTIFDDTSKNDVVRYDSTQEYIDIMILCTYYTQPATFFINSQLEPKYKT